MLAKRFCWCGCGREFKPTHEKQRYVNPKHRNRAGQKRLRQRAKANGVEATV
jgi:hypothetical protein